MKEILQYVNGTYSVNNTGTQSPFMAEKQSSGVNDDTIVIIVSVAVVAIVLIIALLILLCYFKRNSGQQGTYKPNVEEKTVGAVASDEIKKKPEPERLI